MSTRASAGRYARALLDVVIKEGNPEQVEQELAAFAGLFAGNPELQKALTNPAVPVTGQARRRRETRRRGSSPRRRLGKLLLMLADRDRLALVPELATVYRERLMEHRQVIRAEVTTAVPLPTPSVSRSSRSGSPQRPGAASR